MATCMHGVRLGPDIADRCAWCALEQRGAARVDDIRKLRELIGLFGNRKRDVGSFGGINTPNARRALAEASREAARIYDEIEQILQRLQNRPAVPPRPLPELFPEPGA